MQADPDAVLKAAKVLEVFQVTCVTLLQHIQFVYVQVAALVEIVLVSMLLVAVITVLL